MNRVRAWCGAINVGVGSSIIGLESEVSYPLLAGMMLISIGALMISLSVPKEVN